MDITNKRQQSTPEKSKIKVSTIEIYMGAFSKLNIRAIPRWHKELQGTCLYVGSYLQSSEDFKGEGRGREEVAICAQLNEVRSLTKIPEGFNLMDLETEG